MKLFAMWTHHCSWIYPVDLFISLDTHFRITHCFCQCCVESVSCSLDSFNLATVELSFYQYQQSYYCSMPHGCILQCCLVTGAYYKVLVTNRLFNMLSHFLLFPHSTSYTSLVNNSKKEFHYREQIQDDHKCLRAVCSVPLAAISNLANHCICACYIMLIC